MRFVHLSYAALFTALGLLFTALGQPGDHSMAVAQGITAVILALTPSVLSIFQRQPEIPPAVKP